MSSIFSSSNTQTQTKSEDAKKNSTTTTTPFSGDMQNNYNDYLNTAKNNYNNASTNLNNMISSGTTGGDFTKFNTAFNNYSNMDNTNLNKINTQSYNPNDNADWVSAQKAINDNARLGFGATNNQTNQNVIQTGMTNGSGHQTALANASAKLNSQLASDQATRWQDQYNKNVEQSLSANKQLQGFYNNLSSLGIDYAKLTQEDKTLLLNAYTAQNDALKSYGQAISLGSNPTTTQNSTASSTGTATTESENNPSIWSDIMNVASLGTGLSGFTKSVGNAQGSIWASGGGTSF